MSTEKFLIGDDEYDKSIKDIENCTGGCSRKQGSVNPMLRPAGGFKIPSGVMFILERPNADDDSIHGCMTVGPEDYKYGYYPDPTASRVMSLAKTIGFSYKDIYIVNSLLCAQPDDKHDWSGTFKPCLDQGWLRRAISICNPKVIVTLGVMPLKATLYTLTGSAKTGSMESEVNNVRSIDSMSIYPLYHVSNRGCANRKNYKDDWDKLRIFIETIS